MLNEEKLEFVVQQLSENIQSKIEFYSDDDREFFIENVVNIILLSEQDKVEYNLYCFLEHNYENYAPLQRNLNEGIGSFVKGVVKGVGRALGFGKPAEKIAFGAPPTTTVTMAGKDGKDGGTGKSGGGDGSSGGTGKKKKSSGSPSQVHYHGTVIKGKGISAGDVLSGSSVKAGRDVSQVDAKDNSQVQTGNVEDRRKQSVATTATADSTPEVAQPNTQGQKAAAQAKTRQSMSKTAFVEKHGEEEGSKRYAAHREARRGQAANQRAKTKVATSNQAAQNTKQSASVSSSGGKVGNVGVKDVDFGSGAKGHTMGDGSRQSATSSKTTTTTTTSSSPSTANTPTPKKKSKKAKDVSESVNLGDMYSDYMNRFMKG